MYLNPRLIYNYFCFGKTTGRHTGIILPVSISTIPPNWHVILQQPSQISSTWDLPRQKNDVMSIFKMADRRHLEFQRSDNEFFEKPM